MSVFLGIIFLISMMFAAGAVEANSFLLGFGLAVIGIISGIGAIYFQNYNEEKDKQLYYKED